MIASSWMENGVVGERSGTTNGSADTWSGAEARAPQIVVVDDEPAVLTLLRDVLRAEGYSVRCYDRPSDALESTDPSPGVFLVDLMLPEMTGIELAGRLCRNYAETPIIAISASKTLMEEAELSGLFRDVIGKPFDLDSLLRMVGRSVGRQAR